MYQFNWKQDKQRKGETDAIHEYQCRNVIVQRLMLLLVAIVQKTVVVFSSHEFQNRGRAVQPTFILAIIEHKSEFLVEWERKRLRLHIARPWHHEVKEDWSKSTDPTTFNYGKLDS